MLRQLCEFECRIWGIWSEQDQRQQLDWGPCNLRRLDDNRVFRRHGAGNLARGEKNGEVPGTDPGGDA